MPSLDEITPEPSGAATPADVAAAPEPPADGAPPPGPAAPVSLMITRRQRDRLNALGFSAEDIRHMTPAEAHAHLGGGAAAAEDVPA